MGQELNAKIIKHGLKLQKIFPSVASMDPIALCKKLRRLESIGNRAATNLCNVANYQDTFDAIKDDLLAKLDKLLDFRALKIPVFVNGDPRGHALKIDCEYVRANGLDIYTDWGGEGLLAPDLTEEE